MGFTYIFNKKPFISLQLIKGLILLDYLINSITYNYFYILIFTILNICHSKRFYLPETYLLTIHPLQEQDRYHQNLTKISFFVKFLLFISTKLTKVYAILPVKFTKSFLVYINSH